MCVISSCSVNVCHFGINVCHFGVPVRGCELVVFLLHHCGQAPKKEWGLGKASEFYSGKQKGKFTSHEERVDTGEKSFSGS